MDLLLIEGTWESDESWLQISKHVKKIKSESMSLQHEFI